MATQANQQSWNTNSPAALGDTNYWQTGDIVYNNNQNAVIATTGTATISTNSVTLAATAASLGVVSGMLIVGAGVPKDTIVVSVSASTATISQNVTVALAVTPIQFLVNTLAPLGWVCVQAGNPGVWEPITQMPQFALSTTQTAGTLSNLYRVTILNPATTGTYSLPAAQTPAAGTFLTFKNVASGSVTLTPLATNGYIDAAAITLTQYQVVTLVSAGTTNWYKGA